MIYLLGKGPSIDQWPCPDCAKVYAINDAVHATKETQDVTFVRCDWAPAAACTVPRHARVLLNKELQFRGMSDRATYFDHKDCGLPKRLCTLWMTIGIIRTQHGAETVHMYGFDHLVQAHVPVDPLAYHPKYMNPRNAAGVLQDQRPSGRLVPRHMVENCLVMPWEIPLRKCIIYA